MQLQSHLDQTPPHTVATAAAADGSSSHSSSKVAQPLLSHQFVVARVLSDCRDLCRVPTKRGYVFTRLGAVYADVAPTGSSNEPAISCVANWPPGDDAAVQSHVEE